MSIELSLEEDLKRIEWLSFKCKKNKLYAQNLYAGLCNNIFEKKFKKWSCSWRMASKIVSNLSETDSYLIWYCSGMVLEPGFVEEGFITQEVSNDLLNLGWSVSCD